MDNRRIILIIAIVLALISTIGFYTYSKNLDKRVERVVATTNIPQGMIIQEAMVRLEKVHPENVVEGSYKEAQSILGKKAEYPIEKGEQVVANRISGTKKNFASIADTLPSSSVALGIPTDLSQCVGGQIAPYDYITILMTGEDVFKEYPNVEILKIVNREGKDMSNVSNDKQNKSKEPAVVIIQIDPEKAKEISPYIGEANFILALESSKGR